MERYLSVGGVEIADPARTIAYMNQVGNRCATGHTSADCCVCDPLDDPGGGGGEPCSFSLTVTAGELTGTPSGDPVPFDTWASEIVVEGEILAPASVEDYEIQGVAAWNGLGVWGPGERKMVMLIAVPIGTVSVAAATGAGWAFTDNGGPTVQELPTAFGLVDVTGAGPFIVSVATPAASKLRVYEVPVNGHPLAEPAVGAWWDSTITNGPDGTIDSTGPAYGGIHRATFAVSLVQAGGTVDAGDGPGDIVRFFHSSSPGDPTYHTYLGSLNAPPDALPTVDPAAGATQPDSYVAWFRYAAPSSGGGGEGDPWARSATISAAGADPVTLTGQAGLTVSTGFVGDPACPTPTLPEVGDPGWVGVEPGELPVVYPAQFWTDTEGHAIACYLARWEVSACGAPVGHLYAFTDQGQTDVWWWRWVPLSGPAGAWVDIVAGPLVVNYTSGGGGGGGGGVFVDPATDEAPWYDAGDARSGDVLGVWIDELTLSSPGHREANDRLWGGSLSPRRWGRRELHVAGRVYVRSRAAGEYARHWLHAALSGRLACVGEPAGCDEPDAELRSFCAIEGGDNGRRTLHEVGLIDWQWGANPEAPADCFVEWDATLAARVPWLTLDPVTLFSGPVADGDAFCNVCGTSIPGGECAQFGPVGALSCGCGDQPAREVPPPVRHECYAAPIYVRRQWFAVPATRRWVDRALRITLNPGGEGATDALRNVRLRGWTDPDSLGPADAIVCDPATVVDVQIGCVKYGATLVVDGSTRRSTISAGSLSRSATPYLSSEGGQLRWPEIPCGPLVFAVDSDALFTPPDASILVEAIEVERG